MSDITDRIRKLLNVTEANGATPAEAEAAMTIATELMAKHNITHIEEKVGVVDVERQAELEKWELWAYSSAGLLNGVKFYHYSGTNPHFVGRPDSVEAAFMMTDFIIRQIKELYKEKLPKGLTQAVRANFRKTFKQAASGRVYQRAHEIIAAISSNDDRAIQATGSRALVVVETFRQLLSEAEDFLKAKGVTFRKAKTKKIATGYGTQAGVRAGDRVQLNRQLGR